MYNDVKQRFRGSNVHCGSCSHEEEGIQYDVVFQFPEERNLNGSNADMCFDVAEPSSRDSGDLFELSDRSNVLFYYFPRPTTSNC